MAPLKTVKLPPTGLSVKEGIKTRSQVVPMKKEIFPKRKAEESPLKRLTVKRSAFNELTNVSELVVSKEVAKENAIQMVKAKITHTATLKKPITVNASSIAPAVLPRKPKLAQRKPLADQKNLANVPRPANTHLKEKPPVPAKPVQVKDVTSAINAKQQTQLPVAIKAVRKQQQHENHIQSVGVMTRRSFARKSLELEKSSDNSLYVSALEDLNLEESSKSTKSTKRVENTVKRIENSVKRIGNTVKKAERKPPPPGVDDYDQEQLKDLFSASVYAMDIFDYLKRREKCFKTDDYISRQTDLNPTMRALLVDWMVEVQENFEVNHESLYLGVKLVDLYLSKKIIRKENLQLVGVTALFIACKYDMPVGLFQQKQVLEAIRCAQYYVQSVLVLGLFSRALFNLLQFKNRSHKERIPPALDDFVYVCDGLYHSEDLITMERAMLRVIDYELGIPLSYRFLRRYARCGKYEMRLLTLARYILETSLMDYTVIQCSDSKMAAAALFLALQMKKQNWTETLEYYSGYKTSDFKDIAVKFNAFLHKPTKNLATIRTKYSHSLFYEVAKLPLLSCEELDFETVTVS